MKTLEEVIKAWSICFSDNSRSDCTGCPYADDDGEGACFNHDREDALHYLKEYRSDMLMYAENQKYWEDELKQKIKDFRDAKERYIARLKELDIGTLNPPLTWDEMQKMVGKPVWIIDQNGNGKWYLVKTVLHDEAVFTDAWGSSGIGYPRDFDQKKWQAYRKERDHGLVQ